VQRGKARRGRERGHEVFLRFQRLTISGGKARAAGKRRKNQVKKNRKKENTGSSYGVGRTELAREKSWSPRTGKKNRPGKNPHESKVSRIHSPLDRKRKTENWPATSTHSPWGGRKKKKVNGTP